MKLDPKPQPAVCDRCGKTTTKYVETAELESPPGKNPEVTAAAALALHHGIRDACLSCWAIIQSCVTRAGKVQARKKGTK